MVYLSIKVLFGEALIKLKGSFTLPLSKVIWYTFPKGMQQLYLMACSPEFDDMFSLLKETHEGFQEIIQSIPCVEERGCFTFYKFYVYIGYAVVWDRDDEVMFRRLQNTINPQFVFDLDDGSKCIYIPITGNLYFGNELFPSKNVYNFKKMIILEVSPSLSHFISAYIHPDLQNVPLDCIMNDEMDIHHIMDMYNRGEWYHTSGTIEKIDKIMPSQLFINFVISNGPYIHRFSIYHKLAKLHKDLFIEGSNVQIVRNTSYPDFALNLFKKG